MSEVKNVLGLNSEWGQEVLTEAIKHVGNGGYMPPQPELFDAETHTAVLVQSLMHDIKCLNNKVVALEEHIESLTPYLIDEYFDS